MTALGSGILLTRLTYLCSGEFVRTPSRHRRLVKATFRFVAPQINII